MLQVPITGGAILGRFKLLERGGDGSVSVTFAPVSALLIRLGGTGFGATGG